MSLTHNEIIQKANSIISTVKSVCNSVNKTANKLSDVKSSFASIKSDIEINIIAEDIVVKSANDIELMSKNIDEAVSSANKVVINAIRECNSYIDNLESNYNSALQEGETMVSLPRLKIDANNTSLSTNKPSASLTPITNNQKKSQDSITKGNNNISDNSSKETVNSINNNISDNSSKVTVNSINNNISDNSSKVTANSINNNTSNTSDTVLFNNISSNKRNHDLIELRIDNDIRQKTSSTNQKITNVSSNSSNKNNNNYHIDNKKDLHTYLDNILKDNLQGTVNSSDIPHWKDYVNKLLSNNHLDGYIDNIIFRDKQVLCVTKNNQIISFNNVTSLLGLIDELKKRF